MASHNFVTEKELEEERKRRQEEWERVRKPDEPEEAPEPEDRRPLYERLKAQRDQKQIEFEETHKLKNMLRGLDSEETEFLDYVDKIRRDEEKKTYGRRTIVVGGFEKTKYGRRFRTDRYRENYRNYT